MEKQCTKCRQTKALTEFGNLKKGRQGKCSYCKECAKNSFKQYIEQNREHIRKRSAKYLTEKRNQDLEWYFQQLLRNQVRRYVLDKKGKHTEEILGDTFDNVRLYIEKQFTQGMSWENVGEWHIDHIKPLSSGSTREEWIALNHYTNLQPLWAKDNLKKGAKH